MITDIRLLSLCLSLCLFVGTAFAQGSPAVPVTVQEASLRVLAPVSWFAGSVMSRRDARLAAEIEGRLLWLAEVGARLEQGAEVARIDSVLIEQSLAEGEAAVSREQARLKFLEREVARLKRLAKTNNAAQNQLDESLSEREVATSELAASRARVARLKEQLRRCVIRAPFSGVVSERLAQAGEWADAGDAVARLVHTGELEVQAWVPAKALVHIHIGDSVDVRGAERREAAQVRALVPVGDVRSRLYELRLLLKNGNWSTGQPVKVAVPSAAPSEVIAVPRDALVLRRDGASVYRVREGKAEKVRVETGMASGDLIEVRGDVLVGDKIVVRGGERLRPGQAVSISDAGKTS